MLVLWIERGLSKNEIKRHVFCIIYFQPRRKQLIFNFTVISLFRPIVLPQFRHLSSLEKSFSFTIWQQFVLPALVSLSFPSRDHMQFYDHQHVAVHERWKKTIIYRLKIPQIWSRSVGIFSYKIISHVNVFSDRNRENYLCGENAQHSLNAVAVFA